MKSVCQRGCGTGIATALGYFDTLAPAGTGRGSAVGRATTGMALHLCLLTEAGLVKKWVFALRARVLGAFMQRHTATLLVPSPGVASCQHVTTLVTCVQLVLPWRLALQLRFESALI